MSENTEPIKITHPGQIVQFFGLPYIITSIITDYDPYLDYCKHYTAKSYITGLEHGGAILEYPNPYTDIRAALDGTKPSRYVSPEEYLNPPCRPDSHHLERERKNHMASEQQAPGVSAKLRYYQAFPAQPQEEDAFYRGWHDADHGCVGYYKGDNGPGGDRFYTTWYPIEPEAAGKSYEFEAKNACDMIYNGITRDRKTMGEYLEDNPGLPLTLDFQGYKFYTPNHIFFLKCFPRWGNDNFYLFIYNKQTFEQATGILSQTPARQPARLEEPEPGPGHDMV